MPFNSLGSYTPPAGATTAAPGDVIRSATWNAIFTDIASALTLLGEQLYGVTEVTTTPYVPLATDTLLLMNVAGPSVINLTLAASRLGYPLVIKDVSRVASTNNITINATGLDAIDGLLSITINADSGAYKIFPTTNNWLIMP